MNHIELADNLREILTNSNQSIRKISEATGVSKSYIYAFMHGQTVCYDILNRIANHISYEYEISNQKNVEKSDVEIYTITSLIEYLRERLSSSNIMRVSRVTGLAKSRLYEFKDGRSICLMRMDALCMYYAIVYKIKNHPKELVEDIGWSL